MSSRQQAYLRPAVLVSLKDDDDLPPARALVQDRCASVSLLDERELLCGFGLEIGLCSNERHGSGRTHVAAWRRAFRQLERRATSRGERAPARTMATLLSMPLDVIGLITGTSDVVAPELLNSQGMLEMKALCALRAVCRTLKDRITKAPVRCSSYFPVKDLPRLFQVHRDCELRSLTLQLFPEISSLWIYMGSSTVPAFPSTRIRHLGILYDNRNFPSGLENIAALPQLTGLRVRALTRRVFIDAAIQIESEEYSSQVTSTELERMRLSDLTSLQFYSVRVSPSAMDYIGACNKLTYARAHSGRH